MSGIQIVGAGNNVTAKVNGLGQLEVVSRSMYVPHSVNLYQERAYASFFTVSPSADSHFCYIRNEEESPLVIENIVVCTLCSTEEYNEIISVYKNLAGNPSGGSSLNPLNSNFGSNKKAVGVFQYGQEISGLSNGDLYGSAYFRSNTSTVYEFKNWIVMPRNTNLSFHARNGAPNPDAEILITIQFFYVEDL